MGTTDEFDHDEGLREAGVPPDCVCHAFPAAAMMGVHGANAGEPLSPDDALCPGDVYRLERHVHALDLRIAAAHGGAQLIAPGSSIGRAGDTLSLGAQLTMMSPEGDTLVLQLLRHDAPGAGPTARHYFVPLSPLATGRDYTLLEVMAEPCTPRLADLVCVSFLRGTTISLADGRQVAIESLRPGDRVLTRDHGPQPLRWIARARLRADGTFAPVVITAGTLGNNGDLVLSPHHRVFLYHRGGSGLDHTAELLVQAKHLVDGTRIFRRPGGYADCYSLIFDRHEIVYAEGIPAESLLVSEAMLSRLPAALTDELKARFPGLSQRQHFGTEAGRQLLRALGPVGLFRAG